MSAVAGTVAGGTAGAHGPGRAPAADETLARTLRHAWPALPALLFGSVAVCLASTVTVLLAPGLTPVSAVLAGLLVAPCAAALTEIGNTLTAGRDATVAGWWRGLRARWRFGTTQGLVVAVPVAGFLAALAVWREGGGAWVLPSLALSGAASVLALPALGVVLPLGGARRDLRGRRLWMCALYLVVRWPHRFLAGPALAVLGVWAAVHWSASVLLLVPGPVAIVAAAAVWTTVPPPFPEDGDA